MNQYKHLEKIRDHKNKSSSLFLTLNKQKGILICFIFLHIFIFTFKQAREMSQERIQTTHHTYVQSFSLERCSTLGGYTAIITNDSIL